MSDHAIEYFYRTEACAVATCENVVILCVYNAITVDALRASVEANTMAARLFPGKVVALTLVHSSSKFPTAAERRSAGDAIRRTRGNTRCAAQVLDGDGFWMSTVRSIMTAITLLAPDELPRRTFGSQRAAIEWMASYASLDADWVKRVGHAADEIFYPTELAAPGISDQPNAV